MKIKAVMRKLRMKKIIIATLLLFLSASSAFALRINDPAPMFSLRDIKEADFYLSDLVGVARNKNNNGVILSFFASWCVPCRSELPLINSLVDELKDKGIKIVIVGFKEDFDTIRSLLAELKVDKPVVLCDR